MQLDYDSIVPYPMFNFTILLPLVYRCGQVVTLMVVSSNIGKGKFFSIIENKVTESMTMVAPSGEQIKSLKSYMHLSFSLKKSFSQLQIIFEFSSIVHFFKNLKNSPFSKLKNSTELVQAPILLQPPVTKIPVSQVGT